MEILRWTFTSVNLPQGSIVTWVNLDPAEHDVVADGGAFASPIMQTGQSFSATFLHAGSFSYYCSVHPFMRAVINVQ